MTLDEDGLQPVTVIGWATAQPYPALDTGERWNGAPVLAFRVYDLGQMIASGDGDDGNGEGLCMINGDPCDICGGTAYPVPMITAGVDGDTLILAVPEGRSWETIDEAEQD